MASLEELEARVAALETKVARVGQDAAAARVLAGGADRDVSEIRDEIRDFRQATTASLNALRETQVEQDRKLDVYQIETRAAFAQINTGIVEITALLNRLIDPGQGE